MSKTALLLDYIRSKGKISTAELCEWKSRPENMIDSANRRARELRDAGLINIRKMTKEERLDYKVKSGGWFYEFVEKEVGEQMRLI